MTAEDNIDNGGDDYDKGRTTKGVPALTLYYFVNSKFELTTSTSFNCFQLVSTVLSLVNVEAGRPFCAPAKITGVLRREFQRRDFSGFFWTRPTWCSHP
jgi:hypothetical protein